MNLISIFTDIAEFEMKAVEKTGWNMAERRYCIWFGKKKDKKVAKLSTMTFANSSISYLFYAYDSLQ
jgi:hypothetical protein